MYGVQDKINQILRGAETISRNSMTTKTDTSYTDAAKPKLTRESYDENWNMKPADTPTAEDSSVPQTPRTDDQFVDACPHCGAELYSFPNQSDETTYWRCGTRFSRCLKVYFRQSGSCYERQLTASKAEVERLKSIVKGQEKLTDDQSDIKMQWHAKCKASEEIVQEWKHENIKTEIEKGKLEEKLASLQEAYLKSVERDNYLTEECFESKAEVERLTESLKHAELWGSFEKQVTAQLEIKELKAEVERLRSQLKRAVEIAETSCRYLNIGGWNEDEIHSGKDGWVTETEINEVCASLALLKAENQMNNTTDTPSTEESAVVQTDTPRTDDDSEWETMKISPFGGYIEAAFGRQLEKRLRDAFERLKEQYEFAAESVARMHEAAIGEIRGPIISVIEDIKAVRERAEKAEAERDEARKDLIKNLQTTGGIPWREWSAECAKETRRADENLGRAEKAEAEVERLKGLVNEKVKTISDFNMELVNCKSNLHRAVEVAKMLPVIPIPCFSSKEITDSLYAELEQLKGTLNPTNEDSSAHQL